MVSTTGMVGTVMITKDYQNPVSFATESLGSTRQRITAVDICYGKSNLQISIINLNLMRFENAYRSRYSGNLNSNLADGHFVVAVSSGNIGQPIRCYRVLVRKNDEKCIISSLALPSFFLQDGTPKDNFCKFLFTILFFCVLILLHDEIEVWLMGCDFSRTFTYYFFVHSFWKNICNRPQRNVPNIRRIHFRGQVTVTESVNGSALIMPTLVA